MTVAGRPGRGGRVRRSRRRRLIGGRVWTMKELEELGRRWRRSGGRALSMGDLEVEELAARLGGGWWGGWPCRGELPVVARAGRRGSVCPTSA